MSKISELSLTKIVNGIKKKKILLQRRLQNHLLTSQTNLKN